MTADSVPSPGSPDALADGCICPLLENDLGAGIPDSTSDRPVYYFDWDCPLHGSGTWDQDLVLRTA